MRPDICNGAVCCLDTDPKKLVITGSEGVPGGYVRVKLSGWCNDLTIVYPEYNTADNLVADNGRWAATLNMDANVKNISELDEGWYLAHFTETNAEGIEMPFVSGSAWIYVRHCEKARIKFILPKFNALICGPDHKLWIAGYGAGANAEINIRLTNPQGKAAEEVVTKADSSGRWIAALCTARWGELFDEKCLKAGEYKLLAYQTNDPGFLRESEEVNISIKNCCPGEPPCPPLWC